MDAESLLQQAREVFGADSYAALTGVEIVSAGGHEAVCTLTLGRHHSNARGVAMGGVLFTIADFAAAVAANTDTEVELDWVSLNGNIHYLAPAKEGTTLTAHSHPLKTGRTTALYQTEIKSLDDGKTIAIVETTMMHV